MFTWALGINGPTVLKPLLLSRVFALEIHRATQTSEPRSRVLLPLQSLPNTGTVRPYPMVGRDSRGVRPKLLPAEWEDGVG